MSPRSRAGRVAAVAALDEPTRRDLFDLVARSEAPVSRDLAASSLGLSRSTAAFHLDRLVEQGLLEATFARLGGRSGPGAGRPSKLYRRAAGEVSVSVPERRYDLVGELLAAALEEAERTGRPPGEIVRRTARAAGRDLAAASSSLREALDDNGFEPRDDGAGGIELGNCPFHRLARRHTALVCGLNLELLRGVAEGTGDGRTVVLDPAPGRCCVRAVPA